MEKATIGAILKRRVKEMGYTQERFAEKVGVRYSTLRKYMSGKATYSYELLLLFAEELECSVEYLLGLSKSPIQEHHEIAEQTRLSEKAIAKIVKYAKWYDEEPDARRYIKCLDLVLCEDGLFNSICDYLIASTFVNKMVQGLIDFQEEVLKYNPTIQKLEMEEDRRISMETQQMIDVICKLKDLKLKIATELNEELKAEGVEDAYDNAMKKLKEMFIQQKKG